MRSTAIAATYFDNLKRKFTSDVYNGAALRARGLQPTNNVYEEFYIFQKTLSENELYSTLSEKDRDLLLDFIIEQTLN